jgi:hypothetical protein
LRNPNNVASLQQTFSIEHSKNTPRRLLRYGHSGNEDQTFDDNMDKIHSLKAKGIRNQVQIEKLLVEVKSIDQGLNLIEA